MSHQEFIQHIERAYANARTLCEGTRGYNIKRGMARSISSYVEDLFAVYMAEALEDPSLQFWVDKVVSAKISPLANAKSFKPDLLVLKGNKVTHYFDMKTNMGWNRDFYQSLVGMNDFIELIKGKEVWITSNQVRENIIIPYSLKYRMVIVYGWNINQDQLHANIEQAKQLENVDIYVLYSQDKKDEQFKINIKEFDRLIADAKLELLSFEVVKISESTMA